MEQEYNQRLGAYRILKGKSNLLKEQISELKSIIEIEKLTGILLKKVSTHARNIVKIFLENSVTEALKYVFQSDMRFEIEMNDDTDKKQSKPYAEFYVVETIDGQEVKQLPDDACGGGCIDVVTAALRIAFIELSHKPIIRSPVFWDEPAKNLSREDDMLDNAEEDYSLRFAEYLKKASQIYERDYIVVTHNNKIREKADNTIRVYKKDGISKVEYL